MFKTKKPKFYTLDAIQSKNAHYNLIIGERSNGKTYACLKHALENHAKTGQQFAYVRRWAEDLKRGRGRQLFDSLNANGVIADLYNNEWTKVIYYSGQFKLAKYDEKIKKDITSNEPIGFAFAITEMQHDKSTSYPYVTSIIFDEFLTRDGYLPNEFVDFMNVISTIVRLRTNVKIYMLGNTVNKTCPYFKEMGINNIESIQKNEIQIYTYGTSGLTVAVEYSGSPMKKKPSNVYFAFNNPKLKMITSGVWEMALYPHCPIKYTPKDIQFTYFILFEQHILQCEIVSTNNHYFTFIHEKTTPIKNIKTDLIYTQEHNPAINYRRKITAPTSKLEQRLYYFFLTDRVYYQDNEIGELVRNYLQWCKTDRTT